MNNSIQNAYYAFWDSYNQTVNAVKQLGGNQTVWITETSWPISGPTENLAVPSVQNAEIYYQSVACTAFANNITTYWYTLRDADPYLPSPSFGITNFSTPANQSIYNITCQF